MRHHPCYRETAKANASPSSKACCLCSATWRPTLPLSGHPPASRGLPLMSNVNRYPTLQASMMRTKIKGNLSEGEIENALKRLEPDVESVIRIPNQEDPNHWDLFVTLREPIDCFLVQVKALSKDNLRLLNKHISDWLNAPYQRCRCGGTMRGEPVTGQTSLDSSFDRGARSRGAMRPSIKPRIFVPWFQRTSNRLKFPAMDPWACAALAILISDRVGVAAARHRIPGQSHRCPRRSRYSPVSAS